MLTEYKNNNNKNKEDARIKDVSKLFLLLFPKAKTKFDDGRSSDLLPYLNAFPYQLSVVSCQLSVKLNV